MAVRDMKWSTMKRPWYESASHKYKRRPLFTLQAREMMGGCAQGSLTIPIEISVPQRFPTSESPLFLD